jgi:hypothetical protein
MLVALQPSSLDSPGCLSKGIYLYSLPALLAAALDKDLEVPQKTFFMAWMFYRLACSLDRPYT